MLVLQHASAGGRDHVPRSWMLPQGLGGSMPTVSGKATGSRVIEGFPTGRIGWLGGNCRVKGAHAYGTRPHAPSYITDTHKVISFKRRDRDCKQGNDFVLRGVIGEGQLTIT